MHGYIVSYSAKYARWHHGSAEMSPRRLLAMRSSYYNNHLRIFMIKKHTCRSLLWIGSVVLCNICAGIRNLKPRYYISYSSIMVFLARHAVGGVTTPLASNRAQPRGNAFMNYRWLGMIRIIQSYGFMNMWCHFTQCVSNYKNSEARLYFFLFVYFGIWQLWWRRFVC